MVISTGNGGGGRTAAGDRDNERFIDRHRPTLLRYLEGEAPGRRDGPDAIAYIERVLDEWHERFDAVALAEPTAAERAFWYALYQLEDLAESAGHPMLPYEALMIKNLAEVRELLRRRRPLPTERFMATRPNGD